MDDIEPVGTAPGSRCLELFRRMVGEHGPVKGLWCFACGHGGHSSTWHNLCKDHATAAGIDTRPWYVRAPFDRPGRRP